MGDLWGLKRPSLPRESACESNKNPNFSFEYVFAQKTSFPFLRHPVLRRTEWDQLTWIQPYLGNVLERFDLSALARVWWVPEHRR